MAEDTTSAARDQSPASAGHTSALKDGHQRFLSHAIEHSFECGRRTASDFIRHFPPTLIMEGLERQPALRASILVLTTGIKQRIAIKKEWQDAAQDLQIALDEGEADADAIVEIFGADDRVRYLDATKLWAFLAEGEFWKTPASADKALVELARGHLTFLLTRALEDKLLTHRDIVEGITVEELANRLPKADLGRLIQCALANGTKGTAFTEVDLLSTASIKLLVQHVPLAHIWDTVIVPRIAQRHGFIGHAAALANAIPALRELPKPAPVAEAPTPAPKEAPKEVVKETVSLKPVPSKPK